MTQLSRSVDTFPDLIDLVNTLLLANQTPKTFDGQYGARLYRGGDAAAVCELDWNLSNEHLWTVVGNTTFQLTNARDGFRYILTVKQGGIGGYTYTFPSNVKWVDGTAPVFGSSVGRYDLFTFQYLEVEDIYMGAYNLNIF